MILSTMNNLHRLALVAGVGLALSLSACHSQKNYTPSSETLVDTDWQFIKGDNLKTPDSAKAITGWESVQIPHTPNIEDRVGQQKWVGDAWYKKTISADPSWKEKQVSLRFEAAMNAADVYINGKLVTQHLGGYLPFSVNLTPELKYDTPNEILVHLDNRDNAVTGPKPLKDLDFNTYGGIYRHVSLVVKNPVYITDAITENKTASGGIFVTYPDVSAERVKVQVKTHLRNADTDKHKVKVVQKIMDGDTMVAEVKSDSLTLESGKDIENTINLNVLKPKLWSPTSPNLYVLETQVFEGQSLIDSAKTRIGLRSFSFNEQHELLINGKRTFLRGVNRHQEHPYVGYATSDAADYRDAVRIKSAGFDYVRLSHYPQSRAFMEAADELGLVLLDSILGWQYFSEDAAFQAQIQQTCRDLIRRDRNHASVLAWECSLNESQMSNAFIDSLHKIVHEEYPGANTFSAGWKDYGYDIYLQARQHRLEHYVTPTKPYIVSEYGDWEYYAMNAGLNQGAWGDLLQADRSSRQLLEDGEVRLLQQATNLQEAHNDNFNTPAFADGYWVMFDYNRGYAPDLESSGIMSIDRMPKFSYFLFQSQRDPSERSTDYFSGPMVFIASHWTEKSPLNVRVFSNLDEVELLLNGKSIGRQSADKNPISTRMKHPPFTFALKNFEAGELKAIGYVDGKPVTEHKVVTPGKPKFIKILVDTLGKEPMPNVKDVVFVRAMLLDEKLNPVHDNNVPMTFSIKGDSKLISPTTVNSIDGVGNALLEIGSRKDLIELEVKTDGLEPAVTSF